MDTSKIIIGTVGGGRYTVTAPIVKEDYGLYLKIEGVELPSTYEVDFSNSENSGSSVTMIGNADGVLIPHQFISTGKDVFAFLYHVGADYGRTVYKFRIPNKVRPDRTNEQPTPEEQSTIDQAISALNTAVAQTAEDVNTTAENASRAYDYADEADSSASDARTYASNAQASATSASQSASQASTSATASAQSASQSAQIKDDVESMVDDALASANASAQSASASANSASQALSSAQSASQSASSAQGYASQAQTSAQTASAKAQDASGYAQTASEKASEASQSATTASNKASEASGYATASQTAQGLAESARDDAEQAKDDSEQIKSDVQDLADGIDTRLVDVEDGILKAFPTDTASGAIASFTDGADGLPLKSLVVNIDPVQDLSQGDPSPDNICPISGWTGCEVQRTGVNLLSLVESEMVSSGWNRIFPISLKAGTYIISCQNQFGASTKGAAVALIDDNATTVINGLSGYEFGNSTFVGRTTTITEEEASKIKNLRFSLRARGATYNDIVQGNIKLELGSTATPYEPYTGRSITIDLGQTVYGGKLDVLSGVLRVYPYYASYNGETLTGEWISDRDVYAVGTTPTIGAQVVNIGAEGTEYQLTPHEVNSLLGQNNIWSDTGDTHAEYRADPNLYIQRLTEPDADMIADANIVSGQYFMVGNNLYKATANIASGSAVIVGTNCIRKSLSEALNEINS